MSHNSSYPRVCGTGENTGETASCCFLTQTLNIEVATAKANLAKSLIPLSSYHGYS